MNESTPVRLTVAIPTYRREQVLIDTLEFLLSLEPRASDIVVVDQTPIHLEATAARLAEMSRRREIRLVVLSDPSIPAAMNRALSEANESLVLFLDDDIRPEANLLVAHAEAHRLHPHVLVAGRVIQPWDEIAASSFAKLSPFALRQSGWAEEFIGANFSVHVDDALAIGGFDENFVRVAYRFEAEFAHRFLASGRGVYFESAASVHHLKAPAGGTRTFGSHLTTFRPDHAVGAYYCLLRTWSGWRSFRAICTRLIKAAATRWHLKRPWWIPATIFAELWAIVWALELWLRGPRYASPLERE